MSYKTENVRDESRGFDAMSDKNVRDESRGFDAMSDKNVRDESRGFDAMSDKNVRDESRGFDAMSDKNVRDESRGFDAMSDKTENVRDESRGFDAMSDKTENVRDESRGFDATSDKNLRDESRGFDATSDKNVRDESRGFDATSDKNVRDESRSFDATSDKNVRDESRSFDATSIKNVRDESRGFDATSIKNVRDESRGFDATSDKNVRDESRSFDATSIKNVRDESRGFDATSDKNVRDESRGFDATSDKNVRDESRSFDATSDKNVRDESRGFDATSDKNVRDESRGFDATSDKNVRDESRSFDAPAETKETTTLDNLFKDLGHCGRFQIVFTTYAILPIIPAAWTMLFMAFGGYNPGWRCQDEPVFNATQFFRNNTQKIITPETYYGQNYTDRRKSLESCDTLRLRKNLTFSESASTVVTEWTLVCDNSWVIPVITSLQMAGVAVGNLVGGQIGEKFGRKFSIYGSTALSGLANIIAIFSPSWQMYAAVRFFLGLLNGCVLSSLLVYNSEFASPRGRVFIGGFPFWSMSTFSFALCVMALKNWRYIHLAAALVSLVAFLPVFWLPESVRFLTVHGKLERADKVVKKIARINKKPIPDTRIMKSITNKETEDMKNRSVYSYLDLFHKNLRKSTIVLAMTWFSFSLGYYMIGFGIRSLSGDFFVNFLLFSVLPVPVRLVALALANRVGRRFICLLFIFLSIISSISVVSMQLFISEESKSTPTLVMALATSMMVEAPWGIVVTLVVEHNPTAVRNLSYGFCNAMARVASVITPYVIPKESLPMYGSFLLITFLQLVCFVGHLTLSETKGKPLHDNLSSKKETKNQYKTSA